MAHVYRAQQFYDFTRTICTSKDARAFAAARLVISRTRRCEYIVTEALSSARFSDHARETYSRQPRVYTILIRSGYARVQLRLREPVRARRAIDHLAAGEEVRTAAPAVATE